MLNKISVSAFSDESWGGDHQVVAIVHLPRPMFQHSLMNLGVETLQQYMEGKYFRVFQHSLMNLGVETINDLIDNAADPQFQHSLMNLGVETCPGVS